MVVFSTPTCPHCGNVKRYLKEKGIRFKGVEVSRDSRAATEMVRKTGQRGVPQLWINNRPVVGFDRVNIDSLLNLKWRLSTSMNIQPIDDRLLIERLERGEEKVGSIIIPDTAKEKRQMGVVSGRPVRKEGDGNSDCALY